MMGPANATQPQRKERRRDGQFQSEDQAEAAADQKQVAAASQTDQETMEDTVSA
jgi:hypothetical protein